MSGIFQTDEPLDIESINPDSETIVNNIPLELVEDGFDYEISNVVEETNDIDKIGYVLDEVNQDASEMDALQNVIDESGESSSIVSMEMMNIYISKMEKKYGIYAKGRSFSKESFALEADEAEKEGKFKDTVDKFKNTVVELYKRFKVFLEKAYDWIISHIGSVQQFIKVVEKELDSLRALKSNFEDGVEYDSKPFAKTFLGYDSINEDTLVKVLQLQTTINKIFSTRIAKEMETNLKRLKGNSETSQSDSGELDEYIDGKKGNLTNGNILVREDPEGLSLSYSYKLDKSKEEAKDEISVSFSNGDFLDKVVSELESLLKELSFSVKGLETILNAYKKREKESSKNLEEGSLDESKSLINALQKDMKVIQEATKLIGKSSIDTVKSVVKVIKVSSEKAKKSEESTEQVEE